jgi:hypothetical protein
MATKEGGKVPATAERLLGFGIRTIKTFERDGFAVEVSRATILLKGDYTRTPETELHVKAREIAESIVLAFAVKRKPKMLTQPLASKSSRTILSSSGFKPAVIRQQMGYSSERIRTLYSGEIPLYQVRAAFSGKLLEKVEDEDERAA